MTGPAPGAHVSPRWAGWRARADLEEYAARWQRRAEAGHDVHGEADLVASFEPATVLDAGCGAGRVAIELAKRGIEVIGVDLDDDLLAHARRLAPDLDWRLADLAALDLGRTVELIVQAGNVLNYCRPEDRGAIVARCAEHLEPDGRLLVGFDIEPEPMTAPGVGCGRTNLDGYLEAAAGAGLRHDATWSTWSRSPAGPSDGFAVVLHRRMS